MRIKMMSVALMMVSAMAYAGDVKETKKYLETNSWDECVRRYDQGTIRMENAGWRVSINNWNGIYSCTNLSAQGQIIWQYKCDKEHLSDYPKVSDRVEGIQWVHEYEQTGDVGGTVVTSMWMRYDFPYEKRTTTTKQEVKIVTTVTTNKVETKDTRCEKCGKR